MARFWLGILAVAAASWPVAASAFERAEYDYLLACAGCHRFDGSGSPSVPPLDDVPRLLATEAGRDYVLRVPGVAQAPLGDERLAAVLRYVVGELAGAETDGLPRAEEVGRLRARPLIDPASARARLDLGGAQ